MKKLSALRKLRRKVEKQQALDRSHIEAESSQRGQQKALEWQSTEVGKTVLDSEDVTADPEVGSDDPWTEREKAYLEMSRFDLELMWHDGEELPPRVAAKLLAPYRRRCRNELVRIFSGR